jgi:hypothetical protein
MLRYDERELVRTLSDISKARRTAFALACAQRLYEEVIITAAVGDVGARLERVGSDLWRALESGDDSELPRFEAGLIEIMPDEDADGSFEGAVLEDACASLVYAIRCFGHESVQNAAWSARRAYDTCDRYASRSLNTTSYNASAEAQILSHNVVQNELARQKRDIELLQHASSDAQGVLALRRTISGEHTLNETQS